MMLRAREILERAIAPAGAEADQPEAAQGGSAAESVRHPKAALPPTRQAASPPRVASGLFPGCQAWVAHEGRCVLDLALGRTSYDPGAAPVTKDTLFDLASLTKALGTALVAMRLHSDGQLDLGARVQRDLRHLAKPKFLAPASWADLLGHRSGLAPYEELFKSFDPADLPLPAQARAALARRIAELPAATQPRAEALYSDFGYMLLGWALEKRTGLPLPALFETHLSALGAGGRFRVAHTSEPPLTDAAATERCPWRGRLICGHVHDEHAYLLGGCAGHAGLFANARSVGLVAQALLDTCHDRRRDACAPETVRRFWDPARVGTGGSWRLGFDGASGSESQAGRLASRTTVGHLGFTGTSLWIYPRRQVVCVLLTNRVHPSREREGIKELRRSFHTAALEALTTSQPTLI